MLLRQKLVCYVIKCIDEKHVVCYEGWLTTTTILGDVEELVIW
jgi:hypothetical protein